MTFGPAIRGSEPAIRLDRPVAAPHEGDGFDDPRRPPLRRTGEARLRYQAVGLILAGSDVLCLAAALLLSQAVSVGLGQRMPIPLHLVVIASALWVIVFHGFGLYAPQHLSSPEVFRRVISASSVATVLLVVVTLGTHPALSRAWMGLTWALALGFELTSRRVWNWWLWKLKHDGRLAFRTLVVGTNAEARRLAVALRDPGFGYMSVGHLVTEDVNPVGAGLRVIGRLDALESAIRAYGADCLFVASTAVDLQQMGDINRLARRMGVELRVSANLPEVLSNRLSVKPVGDVMAIALRPVYLSGSQAMLKRTFDLVIAVAALLLSLPIMAAVAAAIRLTSPGPVLFTQQRITSGGRVFTVYKFRTMVRDADRILEQNEIDRSEAFFKLREGTAMTPVGRWLRRLSLDEMPQLLNVVKGDMSLVGPRPLPVEQVTANLELLEPRHEVRAGLTGWWQINGRSDVDPAEAVRMDLFYIENWSLTLDLYIILKTFGTVLFRKGAY